MRELIDLATEKALARLLATVDSAGGEVVTRTDDPDSSERFESEIGDL
jgi:hypothetical protein